MTTAGPRPVRPGTRGGQQPAAGGQAHHCPVAGLLSHQAGVLARSAQVVLRVVRDPDADGGEAAAGVEGQAVHPPGGYAVERRARVPAPERPAQPAALTAGRGVEPPQAVAVRLDGGGLHTQRCGGRLAALTCRQVPGHDLRETVHIPGLDRSPSVAGGEGRDVHRRSDTAAHRRPPSFVGVRFCRRWPWLWWAPTAVTLPDRRDHVAGKEAQRHRQ